MVKTTLGILAAASALVAAAHAMAALRWLNRRGVQIRFLLLRLLLPKYLGQYRAMTRAESGRTGYLFIGYVLFINLALALFVVAFLA